MRRISCSFLLLVLTGCLGLGLGLIPVTGHADSNPPLQLLPQATPGSRATPSTPQASASATLHDIQGPIELPVVRGPFFWPLIALAAAIVAGLLSFGFFFWKRRKKTSAPKSASTIALSALDGLRSMMNPQQALVYASQLSEILRSYIEARFLIRSTRQTTQEFFSALTVQPQAVNELAEHQSRLRHCLDQCDLAKFAHCVPEIVEMEFMEQAVREFILTTTINPSLDSTGKGDR
jgi:hypothetical protein